MCQNITVLYLWIINRLLITCNAIIEDRRTCKQPIVAVESILFACSHGILAGNICLTEELPVIVYNMVIISTASAQMMWFLLVANHRVILGSNTSQRVSRLLRGRQRRRIPRVDGYIAHPFSTVSTSCKN